MDLSGAHPLSAASCFSYLPVLRPLLSEWLPLIRRAQQHEAVKTPNLSPLNLRQQEGQEASLFLYDSHSLRPSDYRNKRDFTGLIGFSNGNQPTGVIKQCQDWINVLIRPLVCPLRLDLTPALSALSGQNETLCSSADRRPASLDVWCASRKLNFTDLNYFIRRRVLEVHFFLVLFKFIVIYWLVIFLLLHYSISGLCLALPLASICFRFIVCGALEETLFAGRSPG